MKNSSFSSFTGVISLAFTRAKCQPIGSWRHRNSMVNSCTSTNRDLRNPAKKIDRSAHQKLNLLFGMTKYCPRKATAMAAALLLFFSIAIAAQNSRQDQNPEI